MIGTSVDMGAFAEIANDERFRAEPPRGSSLLVSNSLDVVRSEKGTDVYLANLEVNNDLPTVDQTLDEMIARCRAAVDKYPKSSRVHLNLGLALLRRGLADEGLTELKVAVSLAGDDYVAASSLAAAHFNAGDTQSAENIYKQIISRFPSNVAGYMGLASIELQRGDFEEASRDLEQALRIDANLANASFLLAVVHFKLGRPNRAIAVFRRALQDTPRSAELNQGLAIAYLLSGELRRAERSFQAALSINPQLTSATHGLATLLLQEKRSDEVIEVVSRHLEVVPDDLESRNLLAQALILKGQYRQARSHLSIILTKMLTLSSKDITQISRVENNIGFCFAREGNYKEAEVKLTEAIERDPKGGTEPAENLARVYFQQGRIRTALDSVNVSLGRGMRSSSLLMLKEACLVNLGRYDEAISEMLRLVAEPDAPSEAYAELGWLFCEWREDYKTAIAVMQNGLDKWSDNSLILNNLAYAHLMNDELAPAHALLQAATQDGKDSVFLTATRGLLLLHEGHIEAGQAVYQEAEDMASRLGNRGLMLAVRQKKCLEIARMLIREGDSRRAEEFIAQGKLIQVQNPRFPFTKQLAALEKELESHHNTNP